MIYHLFSVCVITSGALVLVIVRAPRVYCLNVVIINLGGVISILYTLPYTLLYTLPYILIYVAAILYFLYRNYYRICTII